MKRLFASACISVLACGATPAPHVEVAQTLPDAAVPDAAVVDDAWRGEGCRPIASRSASVHLEKVALSGRLYVGNNHCYLDLPRPLCFESPTDADAGDAGLDRIEVQSLRVSGTACGFGEADFRGKLDGPILPVRRHGSTIEVDASSVQRVTRVVTIAETADRPTSRDELRERFTSCWTSDTSGTLTLDFQVAASGDVEDVRRKTGSVTSDLEKCVIDAARAAAKFDAGTARHVTLPITFARSLGSLE